MIGPIELAVLGSVALAGLTFYLAWRSARRLRSPPREPVNIELTIKALDGEAVGAMLERRAELIRAQRRERYDTLTALAQCNCGAAMTMLKPARATLDDLNAECGMDGMNYFYICFGCKKIVQIGFPDTPEMDLSGQ